MRTHVRMSISVRVLEVSSKKISRTGNALGRALPASLCAHAESARACSGQLSSAALQLLCGEGNHSMRASDPLHVSYELNRARTGQALESTPEEGTTK